MKKMLVIISSLFFHLIVHAQSTEAVKGAFYCPPCNNSCDDLRFEKAGLCPHCQMTLTFKTEEERKKEIEHSQLKIAFYLQHGVEVLDFAGPMEVFAYAGYDVFTVSKTKDPIISQGILKIIPDYSIEDAPQADILAFFGGNAGSASNDSLVIKWVQAQEVKYHFSVCTGAFILGQADILDGLTTTTFHRAIGSLREQNPKAKVLSGVRFVDNGNVITTAGISAGIDGALHLVAKLQGLPAAINAAWYMEYDKWTPGQGLILSEDSPYPSLAEREAFAAKVADYEGVFLFKNNQQYRIQASADKSLLYAYVDEIKYPLHYLSGDTFMDIQNMPVTFIRNEQGKVVSFRGEDQEEVFARVE